MTLILQREDPHGPKSFHRNLQSVWPHPHPTMPRGFLPPLHGLDGLQQGRVAGLSQEADSQSSQDRSGPKAHGGQDGTELPERGDQGCNQTPKAGTDRGKAHPHLPKKCRLVSDCGPDCLEGQAPRARGQMERRRGLLHQTQQVLRPGALGSPSLGQVLLCSPHPMDPPDLCGVQLSSEQIHTDERAGQAAFA